MPQFLVEDICLNIYTFSALAYSVFFMLYFRIYLLRNKEIVLTKNIVHVERVKKNHKLKHCVCKWKLYTKKMRKLTKTLVFEKIYSYYWVSCLKIHSADLKAYPVFGGY